MGQRFGVDAAFGDPILDAPAIVVADDLFGFAGIAPPTLRLYPIETHIAEKHGLEPLVTLANLRLGEGYGPRNVTIVDAGGLLARQDIA